LGPQYPYPTTPTLIMITRSHIPNVFPRRNLLAKGHQLFAF
jgi:hypothetical protein